MYLLEWWKFKTVTTPKAGENVEQKELSFIAVAMQNGAGTLEDSSVVSYKTKYSLTIWSSTCICSLIKYQGVENYVHIKTCSWMYIAVLLITFIYLFILIYLFYLFYFSLCWVFDAARGLSLVAASRGYSSLRCTGFSLRWLLLSRSTGSRSEGFSSCGTRPQ